VQFFQTASHKLQDDLTILSTIFMGVYTPNRTDDVEVGV